MSLWRFAGLLAVAHGQCVTKQTLKSGDGVTFPKPGDSVTMQYTGYLTTGQKFDSSLDHGKPFTTQIGVGQVIEGWDEGVPQMSLGEHAMLHISAACGYGASGSPPTIPPNAELNFDVTLLAINGQQASANGVPVTGATLPAPTLSAPVFASTISATLPSSFATSTLALGTALPAAPLTTSSFAASALPRSTTVSFASGLPAATLPTFAGSLPLSTGLTTLSAGLPVSTGIPLSTGLAVGRPAFQVLPRAVGVPPAAAIYYPKAAPPAPRASLPTCTPSDCGHAISWDGQGMTRPVCLCNPICQTMKDTPGVLPCCPGTQQVCLDPYRSPSPHPPVTSSLFVPSSGVSSWQG